MKNHETELTENEELCDLYRKKAEQLVSQMTRPDVKQRATD